jgi:DNA repair exonuclease SbcCD nuclease subunit
MKLLLLSDVHLSSKTPIARLDDYRNTCLQKFEYVLKYAQKINAQILQAGDLFDKPRDWFILLDLVKLLKKYNRAIICVYGQHDTYMYSVENREYTAMGVLIHNQLAINLDERPLELTGSSHTLYGANFSPDFKIPKPITKGPNILVVHGMISDQALYPGQSYYSAKRFLQDYKDYDLILCGDMHRHFYFSEKGRYLVNTGPMMRKDASHYNFSHEPCFYVYDTETKKLSRGKIPHKPAKEVLSRKHIEAQTESDTMLESFISAVRDDKMEVGANLVDNIHAFLRKNKIEKTICDIIEEVMSRYDKEPE